MFRSCDDVMRLVDGEAHGTWLLGANTLWHGGIHISDVTNPFSALNPEAQNTGESVPLQFMADGTVVAYRLNNTYLTAPYCGKPLRYSSSFVLVKSVCQPDPQKEKSWLEFYCLYMHLAAVEDYPVSPCYKVREGHSGIRLRKYTPGQNGLPEGAAENGAAGDYAAPPKTKRSLKAGDRFLVSRTGRFYITTKGKATLATFGLARLLNGDVPGAEQYWVTLDATLTEPDGDLQLLMPEWMRRAVQQGVYDTVVVTGEKEAWTVSAGTPVGFMGCTESPSESRTLVDKEWYVHLEVLSTDSRMPAFLANPERVGGGEALAPGRQGKDAVCPPGHRRAAGLYCHHRQRWRATSSVAGGGDASGGCVTDLVVQHHRRGLAAPERCGRDKPVRPGEAGVSAAGGNGRWRRDEQPV
ncbi:hypothetical protein SNN74_004241 [Cronobacter turicensis]|uniref:hypothetical protein n=1 Tax=Cronobacter turicensis TaxID=413502 RepID=UPI0024C34621|nr:hypothetical protein [Cronobacter turicensis]ELY5851456.1 hypothetical protein [Cronobacter turicensis]MDK1334349.1 hypothetical protein [Cronobacter turicensis]